MKIIEKIKYELYRKKVDEKEAQIAHYKKREEECQQAEDEMYNLVWDKMSMNDSIKFIDRYNHAARKDYYRDERLKMESNMIERSKEEDINIKLNYFYAGICVVMGALALDTWFKNRE